jgi:hypothetical protein
VTGSGPKRGRRESDLAPPVRTFLEGRGFRVWVAPDGHDYFDLVARRADEIGLVELKLADWRRVFEQALRRRAWADWVAVVLPRRSLAEKILARPMAPRAERVGVWTVEEQTVRVVREARPILAEGEADLFDPLRQHLLSTLDMLEGGILPPEVQWGFALSPPAHLRPSRRPVGKEWSLEEFESAADAPPGGRPREEG